MKFLGGIAAGFGIAHTLQFHNGWGFVLVLVGLICATAPFEERR